MSKLKINNMDINDIIEHPMYIVIVLLIVIPVDVLMILNHQEFLGFVLLLAQVPWFLDLFNDKSSTIGE